MNRIKLQKIRNKESHLPGFSFLQKSCLLLLWPCVLNLPNLLPNLPFIPSLPFLKLLACIVHLLLIISEYMLARLNMAWNTFMNPSKHESKLFISILIHSHKVPWLLSPFSDFPALSSGIYVQSTGIWEFSQNLQVLHSHEFWCMSLSNISFTYIQFYVFLS